MTVSLQFIALRIYLEFISVMAFSAPTYIILEEWKFCSSQHICSYMINMFLCLAYFNKILYAILHVLLFCLPMING